MDIIGDRKFVEVPGDRTHELPPLLVRTEHHVRRLDHVLDLASNIVESEDLIPPSPLDDLTQQQDVERRRMDLALNLVDQYISLICRWQWGDSVLEWIRQCEITFGATTALRHLLRSDIWPHAGRSSFVQLLEDKHVYPEEKGDLTALERAVGLRLTFRQPPPISCFSNQFLFYLNSSVAATAYQTWAHMSPPVSSLPPERFSFQVVNMSV